MNAAVHPSDALLPQRPGGMGTGAALALLVHAGLIAALAFGVNWRAQAPETVSAELWSALPQVAAPRLEEPTPAAPPTPPQPAPAAPPRPVVEPAPAPPVEKAAPPPPDPEIALRREKLEREKEAREKAERAQAEKARADRERSEKERVARLDKARQEKAERERAEKEKEKEKAEREKQQREKAAELKLAQQREENLKRMMGQIGATGSPSATGTAAQDSGPSKSYAGRLVAHIKPNIVFTETVTGNPAAEVEVRAGPSGSIVSRRLVKSSGNKDWDEAVLRAIDRTGTLPRDVDGRVPPTILVAFRPQE